MDKHELNKLIATYIVGIGREGVPNSHLWMVVDEQMSDLDRHQRILIALKGAQLIKESNYFLTLLPKGVEMLDKLIELYKPDIKAAQAKSVTT